MPDKMTVLVGTVGQGIMRSGDGGDTWQRVGINQGLHSDALLRTIASHPGSQRYFLLEPRRGFTAARTPG